jgi:hypothetical protein
MEAIYDVHDDDDDDDDDEAGSRTNEFDIYSKSHICAVSRELVQEIRQVITGGADSK